jgi:two-component system heavy metal sensor histidine kinase CusS
MVQDARLHPRRAMSIALRMTVWYALTAFSLIFVATGVLYWVLVTTLYQEDVRDLADNLNNARLLLESSPSVRLLQPPDRRPSWAPPHQPEIYLRVLDQEARTLVETPGMSDELPPPASAELASIRAPNGEKRELTSQSGTPFLELIVRVPGQNSTESPRFMQVAMDREHDEYLLARYRDRLWLVLTFSFGRLFPCRISYCKRRHAFDHAHQPYRRAYQLHHVA